MRKHLLSPSASILMSLGLALGILVADLTNVSRVTIASAQTGTGSSYIPVADATVYGAKIQAVNVLVNGVPTRGMFLGSVKVADSIVFGDTASLGGVNVNDLKGVNVNDAPASLTGVNVNDAPASLTGVNVNDAPASLTGVNVNDVAANLTGVNVNDIAAGSQVVIGGVVEGTDVQVVDGVITGSDLRVVGAVVSSDFASVVFTVTPVE